MAWSSWDIAKLREMDGVETRSNVPRRNSEVKAGQALHGLDGVRPATLGLAGIPRGRRPGATPARDPYLRIVSGASPLRLFRLALALPLLATAALSLAACDDPTGIGEQVIVTDTVTIGVPS